jgi:hypothetical protein
VDAFDLKWLMVINAMHEVFFAVCATVVIASVRRVTLGCSGT